MKFRYCFYCRKPVTKQNFRSRHLHANLDPNNKNKDEKDVDRKKKKNQGKSEKKDTAINEETMKFSSNDKAIMNRSDQKLKNAVGDDAKDSSEVLSALPVDSFERPSKIRKLSNSDGGALPQR